MKSIDCVLVVNDWCFFAFPVWTRISIRSHRYGRLCEKVSKLFRIENNRWNEIFPPVSSSNFEIVAYHDRLTTKDNWTRRLLRWWTCLAVACPTFWIRTRKAARKERCDESDDTNCRAAAGRRTRWAGAFRNIRSERRWRTNRRKLTERWKLPGMWDGQFHFQSIWTEINAPSPMWLCRLGPLRRNFISSCSPKEAKSTLTSDLKREITTIRPTLMATAVHSLTPSSPNMVDRLILMTM